VQRPSRTLGRARRRASDPRRFRHKVRCFVLRLLSVVGLQPKKPTSGEIMQTAFIAAIHSRNKVRLTFYSKEDGSSIVRLCAPMDYGPSRRAANKDDRFHFWDYDSDTKSHSLSLLPPQVVSIEVLSESFDPAGFVTWSTTTSPWFVKRDWGAHS
jgi:hypothetical protein